MQVYLNKGMSLIEMLLVVALMSVLFIGAMPWVERFQANNQMAAIVNGFIGQLHLARSEAVKRETQVTLCPTIEGWFCSDDHSAWGRGYLIFVDTNRNGQHDRDEGIVSVTLHEREWVQVSSSSAHRNRISFLPQGRAWFSNTTFRFCDRSGATPGRRLIMSNNGRVRVIKGEPGTAECG